MGRVPAGGAASRSLIDVSAFMGSGVGRRGTGSGCRGGAASVRTAAGGCCRVGVEVAGGRAPVSNDGVKDGGGRSGAVEGAGSGGGTNVCGLYSIAGVTRMARVEGYMAVWCCAQS
jgi:hypothetical protein